MLVRSRSAPLEPAGEVDVDDVEAARAQAEVERLDVDDDLVALAHLAEQAGVGPGRAPLAVDLDRQRVLADDDAAAQLQPATHSARRSSLGRIASQTSSIASRLRGADALLRGVVGLGAVGEQDAVEAGERSARWRRCRRRSRSARLEARPVADPPRRRASAGEDGGSL